MPVIKMPMQTVDLETGEVVETREVDWHFAPPDTSDGKCGECAVKHEPSDPHDAHSLAYQYMFRSKHGRWPTWADAIAHCSPETQAAWRTELEARGVWTEHAEHALKRQE